MTKRKISYEQSLALDRGRAIRRDNQRRTAAAAAASVVPVTVHEHRYGNWSYDFTPEGVFEYRECQCGDTQSRPFKL